MTLVPKTVVDFFLGLPLAKKGLSDSAKSGGGFPEPPPPAPFEPTLVIEP